MTNMDRIAVTGFYEGEPWDLTEYKVRESYLLTSLERPIGLQEVEVPRISRQSSHAGGKVVGPKHWPPLHSRKYTWYSFLLEAESTPGP